MKVTFKFLMKKMARFPKGLMINDTEETQDVPYWDLYKTAIDPAGGIRSTIGDMVKYAKANLAPASSPLEQSIALSQQQLYFIQEHNMWIGMNWIIQPDKGLVWHNGETYGFNSILAISKNHNQAVVAMTDTTVVVKDANGNNTLDTAGLQNVAFDCLRRTECHALAWSRTGKGHATSSS